MFFAFLRRHLFLPIHLSTTQCSQQPTLLEECSAENDKISSRKELYTERTRCTNMPYKVLRIKNLHQLQLVECRVLL